MSIDPHKIESYIRNVAQERILPRFQNLKDHEIDTKSGPNDLVTIADREAEEDLTKIFKDILPGSYVVGEEAVSAGTSSVDVLKDTDASIWVIDPVDGTGNFTRGEHIFGTMVALVQKGQTRQSWIYDIPGSRMAIAEQGGGAYINQRKYTLKAYADPTSLEDLKAYIAIGFLPKDMREAVKPKLSKFIKANALNCCAHEYLNLIEGQRDVSFYHRTKPWDHLAGLLLYSEAGGHSRAWSGQPHIYHHDSNGLIHAPNEAIWNELKSFLLSPEIEQLREKYISY